MRKVSKAAIKRAMIEDLQGKILEDGLAKQEYEKIMRTCLLEEEISLYCLISPIFTYAMRIKESIDEIRRLRGWVVE